MMSRQNIQQYNQAPRFAYPADPVVQAMAYQMAQHMAHQMVQQMAAARCDQCPAVFQTKEDLTKHQNFSHVKWFFELPCKYGEECFQHQKNLSCGHNHGTSEGQYFIGSESVMPPTVCPNEDIASGLSRRCRNLNCTFDHFRGRGKFEIKHIDEKKALRNYSDFENLCRYSAEGQPCRGFRNGQCPGNHYEYKSPIDPKKRPASFCPNDNPKATGLSRCDNLKCPLDHFYGHVHFVQSRLRKSAKAAQEQPSAAAAGAIELIEDLKDHLEQQLDDDNEFPQVGASAAAAADN
jgi:uncharacterized C2H2 Zn-finger protein